MTCIPCFVFLDKFSYLCAMMDLLHNLCELCYLKVNIIPIVLTSPALAKMRARVRFRTRARNMYNLINLIMIREYELQKRRGFQSRLVVEIQRFPHDVVATIKYFFQDGSYELRFPGSYTSDQVAYEVRHFVELVNSPHWLAEIKPNLRENDSSFDGCEIGLWL